MKRLRSIIIRLRISKSTTPIPLLRNHRTRTFPRLEPTARRRAVSIRGTSPSDELCSSTASRCRRRSHWCRGRRCLRSLYVPRLSLSRTRSRTRTSVWLGISESASAVSFLGRYDGGTFSALEAAAAGCAVGIGCTYTRDELSSWRLSGPCARRRCSGWGSRGSSSSVGSRCASIVSCGGSGIGACVGGSAAETASAVSLLGGYHCGAFTAVEAATAGGAVGVGGAGAGDELCALCGDEDGGWKESVYVSLMKYRDLTVENQRELEKGSHCEEKYFMYITDIKKYYVRDQPASPGR